MLLEESDGWVLGAKGLDHDAARSFAPPRPACHLLHDLERTFSGAEIGQVNSLVGLKNAD
jgi:hypothetical protein